MEVLTRFTNEITLGLIAAVLLLGAWTLWLSLQARRQKARWASLLDGASSGNVEAILMDHLRERVRMERELENALVRIGAIERELLEAIRFVGLVRYDAFEDVGGAQSFALAMMDGQGNGIVLNGIVGRSDCRVYCKPLIAGRSDRTLSPEEARAVEEASGRAKVLTATT